MAPELSAMASWLLTVATPELPQEPPLEQRLAGIVVDDREVDSLLILWQPNKIWLPYRELLAHLGVTSKRQNDQLQLSTPGGEINIDPKELLLYQGSTYISQSTLIDSLKISAIFDASRYAVLLALPWWNNHEDSSVTRRTLPEPEFRPPLTSLSHLRLDQTTFGGKNQDTSYYSQLTGSGRLGAGVWRFELDQHSGEGVIPQEYFWVQTNEQSQWLFGNQNLSAHPLLPAAEFTGIQSVWSNQALTNNNYDDITQNNFTRSVGSAVQDFAGKGPPGSIAELVIDDRRVAVSRVRLDGTYEFRGIAMPSRQFNRVMVRIRQSSSGAVVKEVDHSSVNSQLLLSKGRQILYASQGVQGDPLHPDFEETKAAGLFQWRYGLTRGITLEALHQSLDDNAYTLLGATSTLGENWLASVSISDNGERAQAYMIETTGIGDNWRFSHQSREFEDGFRLGVDETSTHQADFRYQLNRAWTLGFTGRHEVSTASNIHFLKPGGQWRFAESATISLWPGYEGDYRMEMRAYTRDYGRFSYVQEGDHTEADYRYDFHSDLTYYATATEFRDSAARLESGVAWLPNDSDGRSRLNIAGLVNDRGKLGYLLQWDSRLLPGIFSRLEIRDEPSEGREFEEGLRFQWTVTADFSFSGLKPRPSASGHRFNRTGSISGRLHFEDADSQADDDVKQVSVLLNGAPHRAVKEGRYFHLPNVAPGIYSLRVDTEYLPLEVVPQSRNYIVEVASGAVTEVQVNAHIEYSAAGRVLDHDGSAIPGALVEVTNASGFVQRARTDQFGLYRVDSLRPGRFEGRVIAIDNRRLASPATREITVSDGFLFDQDITLPAL